MKAYVFCLLLASLFFTTCEQEKLNISPLASNDNLQALVVGDDVKGDKGEDSKVNCFELLYPVTITLPDGSVLSGNEEDLWDSVKAWYEANPNAEDKPILNYPVDVIWDGEIIKSIADKEEMEIAKKYCDEGKSDEEDCFSLVYPVTWSLSDGSTVNMNDEEDWDAIKAWYEANPNSEDKPVLNYPVEILFKDGTTLSVSDESEMESIKEDCM